MAQRALQAQRVPQGPQAQRGIRDRLLPHIQTLILGPVKRIPPEQTGVVPLLEQQVHDLVMNIPLECRVVEDIAVPMEQQQPIRSRMEQLRELPMARLEPLVWGARVDLPGPGVLQGLRGQMEQTAQAVQQEPEVVEEVLF